MEENVEFNTSNLLEYGMKAFSKTESGSVIFEGSDLTKDISHMFIIDFMGSFNELYSLFMTRYGIIPFDDFVVFILSLKGVKVKIISQLLSISSNTVRVKRYRMNRFLNEKDICAIKNTMPLISLLVCILFVFQPVTAKKYTETFKPSDFYLAESSIGKHSQLLFDDFDYYLSSIHSARM